MGKLPTLILNATASHGLVARPRRTASSSLLGAGALLPLDIPLLLLAASTTTATLLLLLLLLLPLAVLRPVPGPRNAIQGCVLSLNTPTCERPHRPEPRRVELLFLDVATTAALPCKSSLCITCASF